ncbi:MAG: branched-chain amino acid ABC transporter permease [Gaiellaceae bacterium]
MSELVQLGANGLVTGSILAIAAVGVSLVYGILRIVNFAHGDYLVFGAYIALLVNVTWGGHIVVAAIAAVVLTALLAAALEFALWRPLRRKRAGVFSLFIAAIGLALVLRHVIFLVAEARPRRYNVDVFQVYELGPIRLSQSQLVAVAIAFAAIVLVGLMLARTGLGKAMRALSDDRSLAAVAGIDVDRTVVVTWILAGGLAGVAGLLQGLILNSFTPNFGFMLLLPVFAAVVLGGIGSAYGALVGGLALGLVMELSTWSSLAGGAPPVYKPVVAFAVLILVLLLRPQGVFGKARLL